MRDLEREQAADNYADGKEHARKMIREALLRLDHGNKGGKWSIEFVLKFLALDPAQEAK